MPAYASADEAPWAGNAVTEIEITDGITSLGAYNFAEFTATVNIPKSVTAIDTTAIKSGSTLVGYDNSYAKTFAADNGLTFTNLGAAGTIGNDLYWHLDLDTGLFTVSGTGTSMFAQDADGNMLSPSSPWTESNWAAAQYYNYRNSVKKIVIEAPIKSIQSYCLTFINNCTTVELPEVYTGADTIAFHGMTALTCIYTKGQTPEVGTANLSNLTIIGNYSMVDVPVTKVILNDKVTSIGTQVFYGNKKLAEINIPESLKSIGKQAFYNCQALTSLTLPASVTSVDATAFEGCTGIKSLTVKNSSLDMSFASKLTGLSLIVAHEGSAAQTYATANNITFEAYEEVIASGECGTDLYWKLVDNNGTGVLKIYGTGTTVTSGSGGYGKESQSIFYDYRAKINKIEFCDSVTTIGSKCFYYITGLKEVELTSNIKTIGDNGFGNCGNLSTIYIKGNEPVVGTYDLSYVTSMTGGYQFDGAGKSVLKKLILSDDLTGAIGDKFVSYNSSLTEIEFPAGVTSLGNRVVYNCSALKTMTVLGANTTIGESFLKTEDNTTVLTTIRGIEGSSAQTYANANNINFVSLTGPIATGKAGENLVWSITEESDDTYTMTISGTGTYIQPYITATGAFDTSIAWNEDHSQYDWAAYANSVKKIVIEAPVTKVLGYTFSSFNNATTLELPTSMTALQLASCFNDMDKLKTVYTTGQTPEEGTANLSNISYIYDYAFVKSAFKKIIFKENVNIGKYAFMWNTGLETLELPEGVTIGSKAFGFYTSASRNKLTSISFPESLATIPYDCFRMTNDNSTFSANSYVTTITVKNASATFEGATDDAPYTAFLDNFTGLTTVYGYAGSTAEAMVEWANANTERELTFIALEETDENVIVKDKPIGEDLYFRILLNEDGETYTMDIYGTGVKAQAMSTSGVYLAGGYDSFVKKDAYKTTNYYEYISKITKIKFSAPNITTITGYLFQNVKATELELHLNMTALNNDSFNGISTLTTVYTTGQTAVEGVANLTNVTSLGGQVFYCNRFTKVVLSDKLTSIPSYAFGNQNTTNSQLESIEIPARVTSIAANAFINATKLVYIKFNNNSFTYQDTSFKGIAARTTIIAAEGSTGEALASALGVQFIDSANVNEIAAYYVNSNSVVLLDKVSDTSYTAFCTGSGTYFNMGYNTYSTAVSPFTRVWGDYVSLITKAVYVNPDFKKIDSSFAMHKALKVVELPESVDTLTDSCFNQSGLTTLYITGNEMAESVVDLSHITTLGGMAMAQCQATSILLSDYLTGTWGNNMFWNCSKLTYIRIPKGVTGAAGTAGNDDPFNSNTVSLTTVLIENPDFVFTAGIFEDSTNLSTIIGYKGSTAETFATNKGLTFIPLDSKNVLTFEGFQIRETDYNGLRSIFSANLKEIAAREAKGLKVVEIGSLLASTDKLTNADAELVLTKNADGAYTSHSFVKVVPVYQNGERVGRILSETDELTQYACTVTNFSADNYDLNVTFRGYIVYADNEGNEYIVYADLSDYSGSYTDANGVSYNIASLESICKNIIAGGTDLSNNVCWLDILKFREEKQSAS